MAAWFSSIWRQGWGNDDNLGCFRDECRRRMVQGEFEVAGAAGGTVAGHGGITGPGAAGAKLPGSPDSPVSDVNSILAGAHLQVGTVFYIFNVGFMTEDKHET